MIFSGKFWKKRLKRRGRGITSISEEEASGFKRLDEMNALFT
jgi:hypothetical protein